MYTNYFGLTEGPFSITPDPRYLYLSPRHREALGHLIYGIQETGGFVCLTGEVGTGKTTVTRALLSKLPENVDIALILNPRMTVAEFLAAICDELRIDYPAKNRSVKVFVDALNQYLLTAHAENRRVVLIIDEAQNLIPPVLEQVRLLTNLETDKTKLLQIVLVGQPELNELLSRRELRQLSQRITARYHLQPLSLTEVSEYINHRVRVAGCQRSLFSNGAVRACWMLSGGIPRIINVIADRALLGAYAKNSEIVSGHIVKRSGHEVRGELADLPGADDKVLLKKVTKRHAIYGVSAAAAVLFFAFILNTVWFAEIESPMPEPIVASANSSQPDLSDFPKLALDKWMDQNSSEAHATMVNSLQDLLALWDIEDMLPGDKPCQFATRFQLRCETGSGDLSDLKKFDRPSMLYLLNPGTGSSSTAILEHVTDTEALLMVEQRRKFRVSLNELSQFWTGDFLYVWREPPGYSAPLRYRDKSPLVPWLRERLFVLEGTEFEYGNTTNRFDESLLQQVKRFQLKYGLEPDGIVGPRTLMLINALSNPRAIPRLASNTN